MPLPAHKRTIDDLTKAAAAALAAERCFEAERAALEAIALARREGEFERMARNVATLEQARGLRLAQATSGGMVTVLGDLAEDGAAIEPGCYLVQPPLVGADARRFRLAAFGQEVAVAVLCREPMTRRGLLPVVAISADATVRQRVDPPEDLEAPGLEWFLDAIAALGDAAIDGIDPELEILKRVDALLARVDAVPEHQDLHRCLRQTCEEAKGHSVSAPDVES